MLADENIVEELAAEATEPVVAQPPVEPPEELAQTPNREVEDQQADAKRLRQEIREELLGELDRRLGSATETIVSRLKQSQRASHEDWARKQYAERAQLAEQLVQQLVTRGRLNAEDAEDEKDRLKSRVREDIDKQVLELAKQDTQAERRPESEPELLSKWEKTWKAVANEYDLTPSDAEWKDFAGARIQGADWDEHVSSLRKAARQASKKKDKREAQELLAETKQTEEQKKVDTQRRQQAQNRAVPLDGGGGAPVVGKTPEEKAARLKELLDHPEVRDPVKRKAWQKEADELYGALERGG